MQYTKVVGRKGFTSYQYDGKFIYSAYDPYKEATQFIEKYARNSSKFAITLCGADFVNELLLNYDYNLIISFDFGDFDSFTTNDNILRISTLAELEQVLLKYNITAQNTDIFVWTPYTATNPNVSEILHNIPKIIEKSTISQNTANKFGFIETKNDIRNILTINNISALSTTQIKQQNPAIIISSGASLNLYVDLLTKIQNKTVVFALPSALPFLQQVNIIPDFVIATDPGYPTYYHLSKFNHRIHLICPISIHPTVLRLNYEHIFFNYCNFFDKIIFNHDIIASPSEGSVFFNAIRIIKQLGFSQIVLLGQDFSFYNNRSHVPEGFFEQEYRPSTSYTNALEQIMLKLRYSKDSSTITACHKEFHSDIALKIYFEHFLSTKFDIELLLPNNVYNPISTMIKKVNSSYFEQFSPNINKNFNSIIVDTTPARQFVISHIEALANNTYPDTNNELFIDTTDIKHARLLNKYKKRII